MKKTVYYSKAETSCLVCIFLLISSEMPEEWIMTAKKSSNLELKVILVSKHQTRRIRDFHHVVGYIILANGWNITIASIKRNKT